MVRVLGCLGADVLAVDGQISTIAQKTEKQVACYEEDKRRTTPLSFRIIPVQALQYITMVDLKSNLRNCPTHRTPGNQRRQLRIHCIASLVYASIFFCQVKAFSTQHNHQSLRRGFSSRLRSTESTGIIEVDVRYGSRRRFAYVPELERYVVSPVDESPNGMSALLGETTVAGNMVLKVQSLIVPFLKRNFFPEGVTPSYYRFVKFRVIQRFINSIVHVLGTQSLLMGLGLKTNKALGLSAALNWVLKDALGKLVRLVWGSRMGGKFDSDAKRWRFRSSIVYAMGNALEIVTYINPQLFLVWATLANCCKQISMLTSSATRTAINNSFRTAENIADITAKGEAQIAVVDILGIATGVMLSKYVGMKASNVVGVYLILQATELYCLYRMINAVEFQILNFERMVQIIESFVTLKQKDEPVVLPTPTQMAKTEKIFLPPDHLARRAIAFGSLGRAKLAPDELEKLLDIFQNEKFMLVVGADVKNRKRRSEVPVPQENCHIVLHANATNADIVKGTLALTLLRRSIRSFDLRSRDCYPELILAYQQCDKWFPSLLRTMAKYGWAPPARFMFGRVTMRAEWPLKARNSPKAPPEVISAQTATNVGVNNVTTSLNGSRIRNAS